jgi:hypothetical protein
LIDCLPTVMCGAKRFYVSIRENTPSLLAGFQQEAGALHLSVACLRKIRERYSSWPWVSRICKRKLFKDK